MLVLCGHTAVFVSPWRLTVVVGCLLFVYSWSARSPCDVMLGIVPAWDRVVLFWGEGGCLGEGGCDGMSLVGES